MSQPVTTIAPHTFIKGDLRLDGPAVIAGHVQGSLMCADTLEIGPEGIIDGNIEGVQVTIHGTVKGNIIAAQSCRLGATARVAGDLSTADIAIARGAQFIGQVCVGDDMAAPEARAVDTPAAARDIAADLQEDAAEEAAAIQLVEATISRIERTAARIEEQVITTAPVTMTMPTTPAVQVLAQTVQALQRAPRIIKAR